MLLGRAEASGSGTIFCNFKHLKITGNVENMPQLNFLKLTNNVVGDGKLGITFTNSNGIWDWRSIEGPRGAPPGHNKFLSMLFSYGKSASSDRLIMSFKNKDSIRPFPLGKSNNGEISLRLDNGAYVRILTSKGAYFSYELPEVIKIFAPGSCGEKEADRNTDDIKNRLAKLKKLENAGLITKEEAAEKRKAILTDL